MNKVHDTSGATSTTIHSSSEQVAHIKHIWAFGIVTVIGGQYYGWNAALEGGFIPYLLIQFIMGTAFIAYMCCASEVIGKIAFSGGAYGLSRVTLGFYAGFIVGYMELLEYVAYTAVSVVYVAKFLTDYCGSDPRYEPLFWLVYYIITIRIYHQGGKFLWNFMLVFAMACLLPLVIYCFCAMPYVNYSKYATLSDENGTNPSYFGDNVAYDMMKFLPYTTWAYGGVESLALVTSLAVNPKKTIPLGIMSSVITLFVTNISVVCIMSAMPPGINETIALQYPTNLGYTLAFNAPDSVSTMLMLPAQIGMAMGFMLPYARLTHSLAESNLLPQWLGLKDQKTTTRAMIVASAFGYVLCIISFLSDAFQSGLQNLCILAACLSYLAQIAGFVMLRTTYNTPSEGFSSPLGIGGAVYSSTVYLLLIISIVCDFQGDNGLTVASVTMTIGLLTIYYHTVCKKRQQMSKEEEATIFRFTIIKFNRRRAKCLSKRSKTNSSGIRTWINTQLSQCSIKHSTIKKIVPGTKKIHLHRMDTSQSNSTQQGPTIKNINE